MQEKILYYLGAGASCNALPLAKSIREESTNKILKEGLIDALKSINPKRFNSHKIKDKTIINLIINYFKRFDILSNAAMRFGDVDTYAKFLLLNNPSEFNELKKTLSDYFTVAQLVFEMKDDRYLSWLIGIMNRKSFPENIKVLSWNYDYQLQLASKEFGDLENVNHDASGFSHSPPFINHFPNLDPTFSDFEHLSMIHLNGIAGYKLPHGFKTGSVFNDSANMEAENILKIIDDKNFKPNIHFAWERGGYHNDLMKHVEKMIHGTNILVVIGYSFPFYNREVDKQVFHLLKENSQFRKIYFQDPKLTGEQLKSQFNLDKNFDIVHITDITNFHIPFEY